MTAYKNNGLQALIDHIEIDPVTLRERDVYASKRKEWIEYRQAGGELSFDEWILTEKS